MKPRFLKPLHFCSAKIIPLVFDNSLSYYEQLCAFSAKLNHIIDYVNSMSLGLTEFYEMVNAELGNYVTMTEFNEFKEYVLELINSITVHGVGETIEPGTEYIIDDVTYTAGNNCEIFNSYEGEVRNKAAGADSHAEGINTAALIAGAHTEGINTIASGNGSHAEGAATKATQQFAHAEGNQTLASGNGSHAENLETTASGDGAHAEGYKATASALGAHAEGYETTASNQYAHAEGYGSTASGTYSHAEGYNSIASGAYSHAENGGKAAGAYSHCEGWNNDSSYGAIGDYSHVEGYANLCAGPKGHAEGSSQVISDVNCTNAHAEGASHVISESADAHAEGSTNKILLGSNRAHAEGYNNIITGTQGISGSGSWEAHAEGEENRIERAQRAHAEGWKNSINSLAYNSHVEGESNTIAANAENAHAHGRGNTASAVQATATGLNTTASGIQSTTMGEGTIASGADSLAIGKYNVDSGTGYSFIIGDGTDTDNRSNVMAVDSTNHIVEFPADIQFKLGSGSPFTPGSGGGAPAVVTGSITAQTGYKFDESGLESSVTQQGNVCVCNIQVYPQNQYSVPATYQYTYIGDISGIALPTKKIFMPAVIVTSTATAGETQAAIVIDTTGKIEIFTVAGTAWTVTAQTGIFATITYTV